MATTSAGSAGAAGRAGAADGAGAADDAEVDRAAGAFAERLVAGGLAALEMSTIDLGRRLDLYRPLRGASLTAPDLAARRQVSPRYVREWLEQQATAGILTCPDAQAGPDRRHFTLPEAHARCLLDPEDPVFVASFAAFGSICAAVLPSLAEVFRSGAGLPYASFGLHEAQGEQNRPVFAHELLGWLQAVPGLTDRLARPGAHLADVGCGVGWATLRLAELFPGAKVDGFDADPVSVRQARRNAEARGVTDRVHIAEADITRPDFDAGPYDLVLAVEMVHDLAAPVEALAAMGRMAGEDGVVLVIDERVGEEFAAPGDELERLFYAFSVLHCLPVGMAEPGSEATGTVMRPQTLRSYAERAGFSRVDEVDLGSDIFRGYRLVD